MGINAEIKVPYTSGTGKKKEESHTEALSFTKTTKGRRKFSNNVP